MNLRKSILLVTFIAIICQSCIEKSGVCWLDEMDLTEMTTGWGKPVVNFSLGGNRLTINGVSFDRGIGTHAISTLLINLHGSAVHFSAKVGLDDEASDTGSIAFYLLGDKKIIWKSGPMRKGIDAKYIDLDLSNIQKLGLLITDAGDGMASDHADIAEARIVYSGKKPTTEQKLPETEETILTPPSPPEPRINGAKIYGARKDSPFLYKIPVTGERPVTFSASNLPSGLQLDSLTGIITGRVSKEGRYSTIVKAKNKRGESSRDFIIVVGETLALTPPMGWNSWYIHYHRVTDSLMRQAADQMVSSGMADFGYNYVNIDGCWNVKPDSDDPRIGGMPRDKFGQILPNKNFPDMKRLTDYIHSKGLKAGIYSSPGPLDCAGYEGSYGREKSDARSFASWGFDFLKYDWCSYGEIVKDTTIGSYKKPYQLMWSELQKQNRDIVFNLCQYGMGKVWEWGAEVGNSWRTTYDLGLESVTKMPAFFSIGLSNSEHYQYAKPGAWNDPDYLLLGWVGSAYKNGMGEKTRLSPDEQYFYMSMWSLMAAPLIFSGDMEKLDPFTLNILCNNEVIDVNQDMLGREAKILRKNDSQMIMVKDLEDGSKAVGLFHISTTPESPSDYFEWDTPEAEKISVSCEELGLSEKIEVRDIWRQKNVGCFEKKFEADVPFHGVVLVKISQIAKN